MSLPQCSQQWLVAEYPEQVPLSAHGCITSPCSMSQLLPPFEEVRPVSHLCALDPFSKLLKKYMLGLLPKIMFLNS